jgi:uncharacterized protein YbbC (DUF1343 family)
MDGWKHGMTFGDTGWIWVPTSQHIPQWTTSYFYAMTGTLGELGVVSVGIGTPTPFELVGATWLDSQAFARNLTAHALEGVIFRPLSYSPRYALGTGKMLHGVQIHISDYNAVNAADVLAALIMELVRAAPERNLFAKYLRDDGSPAGLSRNQVPEALISGTTPELEAFKERRKSYLLYLE